MAHATIEWVYVGVVIAILCYIGADAWNVERLLEHAPENAQVIKVTGQQWLWTFEHEDGKKEIGELHIVKGVPYRFEVTSLDVIHAFNIPDFTTMMDAVPGRVNSVWLVPDQSGEYLIQCREYCGFSHYQMRAKLIVEEPGGEAVDVTNTAELAPSKGATALAS
jgi:cytochrome c oxidase subunit 2